MALRAGYYGVKRWLWDKLQSIPDKVEGLIDSNNITGAKNFIPPSLNTGTFLNVVFTNNGGVINLNGTANATNSVALTNRTPSGNYFYLPIGKYKYTAVPMKTVEVGTTYSSAYKKIASSSNGEVEFEITADTQSDYKLSDGSVLVALYIGLVNTTVYNNVKVYPMIRIASVTDDTFAPYAMTNQELTNDKVSKTLTSTDAKTTVFSESSKVSSVTAILNDLLVSLRLTSTSGASASGSWTTIATLNEAYRPAGLVYEAAIDDAGNPFGWVRIHGDTGVVEVYQGSGSTKTVNLSSLYFRSTSVSANRDITPDERSLEVEEPEVVVKKSTRKTTKKTEEEE